MTGFKAAAKRGANIPGTWRAVCTCGWTGMVHGGRGARAAARAAAYQHEFGHEDGVR